MIGQGLGRALTRCALALLMFALSGGVAWGGSAIIEGRVAGRAGPQLDASALSPQPMRQVVTGRGGSAYIVRQGDTLSGIAAAMGVSVADLVARNGLANADQLQLGQALTIVGAALPAPNLTPGPDLARVQLWPWPPSQGQTVVLWFEAQQPLTLTATLAGRSYPVQQAGRSGWVALPIPALTAPGPLRLTLETAHQRRTVVIPVQAGAFPSHHIPQSTTDAILTQAEQVRAETARMTALFERRSSLGWSPAIRFAQPLDGDYPRTSPFGSRRTYGADPTIVAHAGEDFSAAVGTPVYSPAAGVVVLAETLFVRGNAVVIDHGNGIFTGYWHLSKLLVASGAAVRAGDLLGEVGSTGLSTGAHLHWELRVAGQAVDPLQWVAR